MYVHDLTDAQNGTTQAGPEQRERPARSAFGRGSAIPLLPDEARGREELPGAKTTGGRRVVGHSLHEMASSTQIKSRAREEIDSLTALRGIAALWVVLYHYRFHSAGFPLDWLWRDGHLAVDVFFVLSGFIMIHVYGEAFRTGRFDYKAFMMRRFSRIYPVHLVTTLVIAGLYLVSGSASLSQGTGDQLGSLWVNLLMLQAWNLTASLYLNYPSWSISAEVFAYIFFPAFATIVFMVRRSLVAPLAIIFLVAWCFAYNLLHGFPLLGSQLFDLTTNFSILRIMPEFLLGAAFAVIIKGSVWPAMPVILVTVALQAIALHFGLAIAFVALVPVLIGSLYNLRMGMPRWLVYLGRISYSLYMVHAVVEKLIFGAAKSVFHVAEGHFPAWSIPFTVILAIGAAALTYHFVEKPGRRYLMGIEPARRRVQQVSKGPSPFI